MKLATNTRNVSGNCWELPGRFSRWEVKSKGHHHVHRCVNGVIAEDIFRRCDIDVHLLI